MLRFKVTLLLIVYVAHKLTSAQMLEECSPTNQPLIPYIYFDVMGESSRACTPVGPSRDALVCVRSEFPTVSYTRLRGTNRTDLFCVLRNTSLCDMNGGYDGIFVDTSREGLDLAGEITIASGNIPIEEQISLYVEFGPIQDGINFKPLEIQSLQLNSGGSVVISDKVFFGQVMSIRASYTVCELMDNGSVQNAPFAALIMVNPKCNMAASGSARQLSVARTVTLHDRSSQVKNFTLFLTDSAECTDSVLRISNNFAVTVVAVTTFSPTTQTTQSMTVATVPPGPDTGTIAALTVAVGLSLLLLLLLFALVFCCVWKKRKAQPNNSEHGITNQEINTHLPSNGVHSRFTETPPPLRLPGTDDVDSGVTVGWSSEPSTPNPPEIVVICETPGDPWYQGIKTTLGESFKSSVKELHLPKSTKILSGFESDLYHKLASEHCRHSFVFMEFNDSKSNYSCTLHEVIKSLESRPCPYFAKVWVISVGAPELRAITYLNINRLYVTQTPGEDASTSEKCAQSIFDEVSKWKRSLSCVTNGQNLASASLSSIPVHHPSRSNGSATDPLSRRDDVMMMRIANANERAANASERAAVAQTTLVNAVTRAVDSMSRTTQETVQTGEAILKRIDEVNSNVQQVGETVQHVEVITENEAIRRDRENIAEEENLSVDT